MFIFTYAAALLATVFTVWAAALLFSKRKVPMVSVLVVYLLASALWIGSNAAADVSYTPRMLIVTSNLAFLGGILTVFCIIVLVDFLIDRKLPSVFRCTLYAVPAGMLCILGFTPLAIVGTIFPPNQPAQIIPGVLYNITLVVDVLVFGYSIIRLCLAARRQYEYTRKMQLLYVLTGLLITIWGQSTFDVALPLMGEFRFYTLGPVMSVFFAVGCAYAILRHNLLDIRLIIERGAIYSCLLIVIILTYLGLVNVVGLFVDEHGTSVLVSAGITTILGIVGAPLIEQAFRKISDRVFFKDRYNYAQVMHTLSTILYTNIELSDIIRDTEETLTCALRTNWVRVVLDTEVSLPSAVLTIPIQLEGKEIASLQLGEKRSGDPYTKEDRQLLSTFAYQAATAFSRARLYEEVKHHAEDLAQKVEQRTEELRVAQESQRQMIVDIAHNLQTPLAIFQTKLDTMKRLVPDDPDIATFQHWLLMLSNFIYDLLSLASIEQLKVESMSPISLSRILDDIVEMVTISAAEKDIQVRSSIEPNVMLLGNEKRLREALMNLIGNAIKYMRDSIQREISIVLVSSTDGIHLEITDTGIGIPEKEVDRVFERFYRGSNASSTIEGNGLGLAIVKKIVEVHSGTIRVLSSVGKGTSFILSFEK